MAQGAAVEIKGVNGGISATGTSGGQVEVTAIKKGRKSDPAQVKIQVVEHAGGVTICAVYPTVDGKENTCAPGKGGHMNVKNNDVNVEFQVKVPAGVRFVGKTVNGGISASGIAADAEAETVNGGVDIDAAGTARATTVNGGIIGPARSRRLETARSASPRSTAASKSPCPPASTPRSTPRP